MLSPTLSSAIAAAKRAAAIAAAMAAAGCAGGLVDAERAPYAAAPPGDPVRARTSFSDALRCMDGRLAEQRRSFGGDLAPLTFTTAEIRDPTRKLGVGGREMVDAALLAMARTSGQIVVRRYDYLFTPGQGPSLDLPIGAQPPVFRSDFAIAGAISQLDAGVLSGEVRGGIGVGENIALGAGASKEASTLTLDLQLIDLSNGALVANAQNSIVLVASDRGADIDGTIGKFGGFLEFSFAEESGGGQAARTLIDLSMIEMLGEVYRVPYWRCLSLPSGAPEIREKLRDWWGEMPSDERRDALASGLRSAGYLAPGGDFTAALSRYQADRGVPATGRPSFAVYAALNATLGGETQPTSAASVAALKAPARNPEPLSVSVTPRVAPEKPGTFFYSVNLNRGAHLACWMETQKGQIVRLFPNPYQPTDFVLGRQPVSTPDVEARRKLAVTIDEADERSLRVACIASGDRIENRLPANLRSGAPFQAVAAASLGEIVQTYRQSGGGAPIAVDCAEIGKMPRTCTEETL